MKQEVETTDRRHRLSIPRPVFNVAIAFLILGQLQGLASALLTDATLIYRVLEGATAALFILAVALSLFGVLDHRRTLMLIIYLSTANLIVSDFMHVAGELFFFANVVLLNSLLLFCYVFIGGIIIGEIHAVVMSVITLGLLIIAAFVTPEPFLREHLPFLVMLMVATGALMVVFIRSADSLFNRLRAANRRLATQAEELDQLRRAAEDRSSETEARYRAIVEDQTELVCRYDANGTIVFANRAFCRYFDISGTLVVGRNFFSVVAAGDAELLRRDLQAGPGGGELTRIEQRISFLPGGTRWVRWIKRDLVDPSNGTIEYQAVGADITDMKAVQRELTVAKQEADEANRAKSAFLANISHEIRNPLNSITGMIDLLLVTDGEERFRYVQLIRESTNSLVQLIGEILDVSAIESGRMQITRNPVEITDLIDDLRAFFTPEAMRKDLDLRTQVEAHIPAVIIDPLRVKQILHNLVGNALKYTDSGVVAVEAHATPLEDGWIRLTLSVADTGIGIAEHEIESLFDDFTRGAEDPVRRTSGVGLGLAISKRLAELMGGTIRVSSAVGRGSRFELELPVRTSDDPVLLRPVMDAEDVAQRIRPPEIVPRRVIVLEDDDANRHIIKRRLELAGHSVVCFESAPDFFASAEDASSGLNADVILMDINMPGMSGMDAVRKLRSIASPLTDVPVVAVTGYAAQDNTTEFINAGMAMVVAKPIDYVELFSAIDQLTDR